MVREHKNNRSDGILFIHIITLELGAGFTISDIMNNCQHSFEGLMEVFYFKGLTLRLSSGGSKPRILGRKKTSKKI
ncbi:MAG: hypothetical protein JRG79_08775 [Deltaproteobacteria bacterium]|nr:hypothetical protein [Deltaproteobacteria bacterium]